MKKANFLAIFILSGMFLLMLFSSIDDSATFDEVAHIGAGYTYLKEFDGRLNPEHPPLVKIISAIPLLFLDLNFSAKTQEFWTWENVNDRQWAAGRSLLYESGNDTDKILLYSRLPIMVLALIFGWILFYWTRKNYGAKTAILTLLLFSLSPTFLAHSRYVTTDLAASMAFFLSVVFFIEFLKKKDKKSAIYFGLIFGLSLLVKFSLVILVPFFIILVIWHFIRNSILEISHLLLVSLIILVTIYIFYLPLTINYSLSQNLADAKYIIGGYKTAQFAPKVDFWLLRNEITRPIGQYLHGFLMVAQRTAGGNSAYFLGEVSNKGWLHYFPVLFLTKEHAAFYILILLAIFLALKKYQKLSTTTITFIAFITYYWAWALWSPLTIGVRHILPTLPFIYILVSNSITKWMKKDIFKKVFIFALFMWMTFEISFVFPHFLSYYNQFAGGWRVGYRIATDSNYDWGQDLKRLKKWVEENSIDKIYLDYFGGGSPKYYLKDKYEFWRHEKGPPPAGSYFAISVNSFVGAENLYYWLKDKKPTNRVGSSIFVFSF